MVCKTFKHTCKHWWQTLPSVECVNQLWIVRKGFLFFFLVWNCTCTLLTLPIMVFHKRTGYEPVIIWPGERIRCGVPNPQKIHSLGFSGEDSVTRRSLNVFLILCHWGPKGIYNNQTGQQPIWKHWTLIQNRQHTAELFHPDWGGKKDLEKFSVCFTHTKKIIVISHK